MIFPASSRVFAALAVLLFLPLAAAWPGKLVDETGQPLSGARITAVGEAGGVVTGADGRFELPARLPPVVLLVELADGASIIVEIPATTKEGEILVQVDPRLSEQVSTTAPFAGEILSSPAAQAWSVSAEQVQQRGDSSLQQTLSQLPGAEPASPDPDRVPVFRGLGDRRTLFLMDGATVSTERRAGVSGGSIHSSTWGGIEVARGPSALIYGSGAMGGVLLVKSPWAPVTGEKQTRLSSEGRAGGAPGWSIGLQHKQQGWSVAVGHRQASDPQSAAGLDVKGEYSQSSVFVGRSWASNGQLIRLGVRGDRLADAFRPRDASSSSQTFVPEDQQFRVVVQIERPGTIERNIVGWWGSSDRLIQKLREPPSPTRGTETALSEAGARITWRGRLQRLHWTAGAEARLNYGVESADVVEGASDPEEDSTPLEDGSSWSAAVFAMGKQALTPWLDAAAGARFEPTRLRADSTGETFEEKTTAWAGSASLIAHTRRQGSFTVQVARSFRVPSITDRFFGGITGRGFKEPSPGLEPEHARHLDLGWHMETGRLQFTAAAYHYAIEEILVREFTAADRYRFVNAGQATIQGLEAGVSVNLSDRWSLFGGVHHVRGETDDGQWLESVPADGFNFSARRTFARRGYLRGEIVAAKADSRPGSGEEEIAGFGVVNLGGAIPIGDKLRLRLAVQNALDKQYRVSPRENDPEAPGRTFLVAIDWSL